ncbi:hypothetical protein SAMN04487950_3527 [Halogranum rubrum]|uniref:Uncharacterized protein n=1 Tax=Halogranum rubrum TaxID=553466 RepID=A0A1I4H830_9EURY|nr:hypothetical protein [Halogranum rubrum]SFL37561.1 hypothetical protein SAMN04487950_3527 [Halogranum rubrum]
MTDRQGGSDDDDNDDGEGDSIGTENTMRARADESRLKVWVLLSANRLGLVALLSVLVFASLIVFSVVLYPSLQLSIQRGDTIETGFTTMISVIVTGTTLVVSINQLVLSQENGPLGDQRRRMSNAEDFRTYTEEMLGSTAPSDPSNFLRALVAESQDRAERLDRLIHESDSAPDELQEQLEEFVDSLDGNAETVREKLDGSQFGTFDVVYAALDYNYSWKVFQVDRMVNEFGDSLSREEEEAFHDLKTSLTMFGPAREHIKTLYFEWALVNLSQYILYAAVPALVVAGAMFMFVGDGSFPGTTLGVDDITWVTVGAFTLTLLPFFIFISYIFRVATVAKRTLAIGPLILRDSQR